MKPPFEEVAEAQTGSLTGSSSGVRSRPQVDEWETALELCQLRWLDDSLTPLTAVDEGIRYIRAKAAGLRRRAFALLSRASGMEPEPYGGRPRWIEREDGTLRTRAPRKLTGGLKAGDLVEVLSVEDIDLTLDSERKHDGLKFLRPMEQYCGRRFRVLKPVRRILDEHNRVMQKTRDTVILDGGICHGRGLYGREGCDRSCFFFWKAAWLRKLEE